MNNRILVPVVLVLVGTIGWLFLDRGPHALQADTARPARFGLAASVAGQTAPTGQFRLKSVAYGTNWAAFRYNVSTGQTSQSVNFKYQPTTEAGTIPSGDYELEAVPMGPNGYAGYALLRLERVSGRTWFLQGNNWVEIQ
jgi:hypothetical protein